MFERHDERITKTRSIDRRRARCAMFLSETLVRVIHADRVRAIERATHDRRLIDASHETGPDAVEAQKAVATAAGAQARRPGGRVAI